MTSAAHQEPRRIGALLSLALPCVLVLLAFGTWAWWSRAELRRSAASGIAVDSSILPRIHRWRAQARPGVPRLALFGDSLVMARDPVAKGELPSMFVQLGPMVAEALLAQGRRNDLVTVAHFAFRPVHYYYLLDEVLAGRPDVAIVSLNLPVFASEAHFGEGLDFKNLSRRLSWQRQREIRPILEHEEISPLDPSLYALQEQVGLLYVLDGVRLKAQGWVDGAAGWLERTLGLERAAPRLPRAEQARKRYTIDLEHPMVETTARLLQGLHDAGVGVLVYVAPIDVDRLRRLGVYDELDLEGQIEALRIAIGATPEEFRDFHTLLRKGAFADHRNHLRRVGLRRLATRVAAEIPQRIPRP
jgi:hypothetical protein